MAFGTRIKIPSTTDDTARSRRPSGQVVALASLVLATAALVFFSPSHLLSPAKLFRVDALHHPSTLGSSRTTAERMERAEELYQIAVAKRRANVRDRGGANNIVAFDGSAMTLYDYFPDAFS